MLKISANGKYFTEEGKPFFWLGDTAWLLFSRCSLEEAKVYLRNRKEKGYNVIQVMVVNDSPIEDIYKNNPFIDDDLTKIDVEGSYIQNALAMCEYAKSLGIYVALVPAWGSMVKTKKLTNENVVEYTTKISNIFSGLDNIIYFVGGDIRGDENFSLFDTMGQTLKDLNPNRLVGFHPFGRTSSSYWFYNSKWLDFNMFQSGHRRYDQRSLSSWDDNNKLEGWYGEDNFEYVLHDEKLCKPTFDSEPSYEQIPQGLHDTTQPYWQARDVRRYAYWSVFAGACGHTYGDNSIIQFYSPNTKKIAYGAKDYWYEALHHSGSSQMQFLKNLMESVDFTNGREGCDLLSSEQKEKYHRVQVFKGVDFVFAYSYLGETFSLNLEGYKNEFLGYWFDPENGSYSYFGVVKPENILFTPVKKYSVDQDWVLVLRKKH